MSRQALENLNESSYSPVEFDVPANRGSALRVSKAFEASKHLPQIMQLRDCTYAITSMTEEKPRILSKIELILEYSFGMFASHLRKPAREGR